ncbi:farnesyl-diphosphate farnesyltransferase [Prosthecobacter fusiformis]|uniref:Farnesyl-diphosphate farnesyltransferase n=1 Tax=Prosthecobacter fusiformis TaxID=48464 RepID=A0A4R7RK47_9BACT|nr:presqualene diphosphate synthase HpnD [Prosthecobacter fusiformis]TDU64567.1 farnesyl-diphosphate farnesyltransferase [Prosthecobacter fusiformis]
MTDPTLSSAEIAQRAKSNLALALACLPEERRRDMTVFYAFCRVVDDIADSTSLGEEEKEKELAHWRHCVSTGQAPGHPVLDEVVPLPRKYGFPRAWLAEIIDGVASDVVHVRYETYEELLAYCYKVASVVGLVSAEIFGATQTQSREYAIQLGYALQLTNIIRDVGQDARETGRIYLPLEDLKRFGVTEQEILEGRHNQRFVQLMDFEYKRAREMYDTAAKMLPREDRDALLPARMMGQVYFEILEKLRRERYPVFAKRCRLHPLRKIWILGTYMARSWIARFRRK